MPPHESAGAERVREFVDGAEEAKAEPPRPLTRELPTADPFPVDTLGDVLASAAQAIHDRVQAPIAMCGQSVLAAATLAVQGHADVELPTGHARPVSGYFVSVAASGERKSAVDHEALRPVREREAALRKTHDAELLDYENAKEAWEVARKAATKAAKGDRVRIKMALDALGSSPLPPLVPILTCTEPTYEGLCRLFPHSLPSIGIFAAEGGQFIGGHGMADDAKLRTAAGLSAFWDGEAIKRVRALDGVTILPGRASPCTWWRSPTWRPFGSMMPCLSNRGSCPAFWRRPPSRPAARGCGAKPRRRPMRL
jgi:hypothetical protein